MHVALQGFRCGRVLAHTAVLCLALIAGGCAQGDFGRISPLMVRDDMHDWVGPASVNDEAASRFPLTSDERLLRDLAYPLIVQPYERDRVDAVVHEYGLTRPYPRGTYDRAAYANHLLTIWRRSPASAYAQLIDDARNDITRLPQFFATAARVRDVDEKRRRSMFYVSALSAAERANALQRVKENANVIDWVRESLVNRTASYRIALEHLVVRAPSNEVVQAEHVINVLKERTAFYWRRLPPPYVREQSLAAAR
jgi:hypothetical protein